MNEELLKALLIVITNDQAYLHAMLQALQTEMKTGVWPDEDLIAQWIDEWKSELAKMTEEIMQDSILNLLEEENDVD